MVEKIAEDTGKVSGSNEDIPKSKERLKIGLIKPIAPTDGYSETHWNDVESIIKQALLQTDKYVVSVDMVSDSNEVAVIHQTIVDNIYHDHIVVVDVSSKNPNVMFELGLRIAFDKPFVLIKDDRTDFTFDTGNIQTLKYPSSLRHGDMEIFKTSLRKKVISTYKFYKENPQKSVYLDRYGDLKPATIEDRVVPEMEYFKEVIGGLKNDFQRLERNILKTSNKPNRIKSNSRNINLFSGNNKLIEKLLIEYCDLCDGDLQTIYPNEEMAEYISNNLLNENLNISDDRFKQLLDDICTKIRLDNDGLPF